MFKKLGELGFAGIYIKEDHGGAGLGRKEGAIIFEALARGDVAATAFLTIHNMCCSMISEFGD